MGDEIKGIHLFSNGTEWDIWEARNCRHCIKEPQCDLADAIFSDGVVTPGLYQGQVTPETAARLGYTDERVGILNSPCKERQADAAPPTPAATQMKIAGAQPLPGFD